TIKRVPRTSQVSTMQTGSLPRRAFIEHAAAAATALAGAAATGAAAAAEEKPASSVESLAAANPADLLLALVKQLDPQRLDKEHLALLRADVELNLRRSALLSRFPLTNADEPAPVFRAWRAEQ
ncbi:MAG: hypothetical protein ACREHD_19140, partial [Pirellulales bacterium]